MDREKLDKAAKFSAFRSIVEACKGASGLLAMIARTARHFSLRCA